MQTRITTDTATFHAVINTITVFITVFITVILSEQTKTCQKEITRSQIWQDRQRVQDVVATLANWIVILSVPTQY